jgi:predicted site-specific integrase-resolvase
MPRGKLPTIREVADEAGVSYWTVRRYAHRGVIETYRDAAGRWRCEIGAVVKVRRHHRNHGAPGGRPLK